MNKMPDFTNHIDERTIEALIADRRSLDTATVSAIESHIAQCAACRETHTFLGRFYAQFGETASEASAATQQFAEKIAQAPKVVLLRPFHHNAEIPNSENRFITVLAAQADAPSHDRFKTVAVLNSDDHKAILRIIHDTETDNFRLYLLTDDPRKADRALVSIPAIHSELVTDTSGMAQFSLSKEKQPADWSALQAFLVFGSVSQ
jgi:hypothetical protein